MRGLLLKDLLNLKQVGRAWALILVMFMIVSFTQRNPSFVGGMLLMVILLMPISALSYDESAKWDRYALTMPVTRRDMVLVKYLLALTGAAAVAVLMITCSLLMSTPLSEALEMTGMFLAMGLCLVSLMLPLMFKYGVQKGRLALIALVLLPTVLAMLAPQLSAVLPDERTLAAIAWLVPAAVILLFAGSCAVSMLIYARKEF